MASVPTLELVDEYKMMRDVSGPAQGQAQRTAAAPVYRAAAVGAECECFYLAVGTDLFRWSTIFLFSLEVDARRR